MSDYLNNLAAKSLNLTAVIQPRLASLFEPPSVVGGPVSGHSSSNLETAHGEQLSGETLAEQFPTQLVPNPAQMIVTQTPPPSPHRNTPVPVPDELPDMKMMPRRQEIQASKRVNRYLCKTSGGLWMSRALCSQCRGPKTSDILSRFPSRQDNR